MGVPQFPQNAATGCVTGVTGTSTIAGLAALLLTTTTRASITTMATTAPATMKPIPGIPEEGLP